MTMPPDFHMYQAEQGFRSAYGDDPNVETIQGQIRGVLRVTLLDPDAGLYPLVIDGIPIEYYRSSRWDKAS